MVQKCSLLTIAAQVRDLAARGAVPTGNWTLAQICDHLARAIEGSLGLLPQTSSVKPPAWPVRMLGRFLILRLGYVPRGVKAPEHVLPPRGVTYEEAIARLEAAAETFESKAAEPGAICRKHPIFGFDDTQTWRRFHHIHARHHLGFMKATKKA
jgi:hypothetical protein